MVEPRRRLMPRQYGKRVCLERAAADVQIATAVQDASAVWRRADGDEDFAETVRHLRSALAAQADTLGQLCGTEISLTMSRLVPRDPEDPKTALVLEWLATSADEDNPQPPIPLTADTAALAIWTYKGHVSCRDVQSERELRRAGLQAPYRTALRRQLGQNPSADMPHRSLVIVPILHRRRYEGPTPAAIPADAPSPGRSVVGFIHASSQRSRVLQNQLAVSRLKRMGIELGGLVRNMTADAQPGRVAEELR